jgi:DNA-binding NarL/FixJ family response regulator
MTFTRKEQAILSHLFDGLTNQEIACKMGTTATTTKQHLNRVGMKLGIDSKRYCLRVRIVWLLRGEFCDIAA